MSRVFVTGGSGFIGTNLIQSLLDNRNDVVNYDVKPPRNVSHKSLWVKGDILELNSLSEEINNFSPDYLIHLAARTDLDGIGIVDYSANTEGVLNVIKSVSKCTSIKMAIFASSRLVCRIGYLPLSDDDYCPDTFYGESKAIGEKIVRENAKAIRCAWIILRPTSIWGQWFDTPYKEFFLSIVNSYYVHPRGHRILKSFGYVGNSVFMIEKILYCDKSLVHGKTLYLADYPPLDVKIWADLIAVKSGTPLPREVPIHFLRILAFIGDLLKSLGWKKTPLTTFRLNNLTTDMVYKTAELEAICGQVPYKIEDGIELTLKWLRLQK